jgi:hypothetical protein
MFGTEPASKSHDPLLQAYPALTTPAPEPDKSSDAIVLDVPACKTAPPVPAVTTERPVNYGVG